MGEEPDERPFSQLYEVLSQLSYDEPLKKEGLGPAGTELLDAPKGGLSLHVARASKPIKKQRKRQSRKARNCKREQRLRFARDTASKFPPVNQSK